MLGATTAENEYSRICGACLTTRFMLRLLLVLLAGLVASAGAVFADEAYNVDFHYALLGLPLKSATFFHQPHPGSKASLLYTLSEKAVVGAVNPKDGNLVWRQSLDTTEDVSRRPILRPSDGQEVIVAAREGILTAWNAGDGRVVWERKFTNAVILDVQWAHASSAALASQAREILVLVQDPAVLQVKRINGETGKSTSTVVLKAAQLTR